MSFKIGFSAEKEPENKSEENVLEQQVSAVRRSVVEVFFPARNLTCSYYNDRFDLKCGDIVYVEGKLEGLRGCVSAINYHFKIKLSDYKRVIGVLDTDVVGEIHLAGSHVITTDEDALKYEKVATWFKEPEPPDEEYVSSVGDEVFHLANLGGMNITQEIAKRGYEYYIENRVVYIELNHGKGRALVIGSKTYDVEFHYNGEDISGLVCNCYVIGSCKHEFATMLQLTKILTTIKNKYPFINHNEYLAAVSKTSFFEFVVNGNTTGTFTIG